jgi:hypothetical protein
MPEQHRLVRRVSAEPVVELNVTDLGISAVEAGNDDWLRHSARPSVC